MNPTWSNHWQDPEGAQVINENVWFHQNQRLLLQIANTAFGRDMLCISKAHPQIIRVQPHAITFLMEIRGSMAQVQTDIRTGSKYGNLIRSRWGQFNSFARYFHNAIPEFASPLTRTALSLSCATATVYPDADAETSTTDGYVSHNDPTWGTVQGASTGITANDTNTTNTVGSMQVSGDYYIRRAFMYFNTGASIAATATISDATLSVVGTSKLNGDNDSEDYIVPVQAAGNTVSSNTGLSTADYDQLGTTAGAATIDIGSLTVDGSTYTDWSLNATGLTWVTKNGDASPVGATAGISYFGLREGHDILNHQYAGAADTRNEFNFYAADQTGTSADPKLVVTYTVPSTFIPRIIIT